MGNNYPPGVTGNEYAIAGPDSEEDGDNFCPDCEAITPGIFLTYRHDRWWVCDVCGEVIDEVGS